MTVSIWDVEQPHRWKHCNLYTVLRWHCTPRELHPKALPQQTLGALVRVSLFPKFVHNFGEHKAPGFEGKERVAGLWKPRSPSKLHSSTHSTIQLVIHSSQSALRPPKYYVYSMGSVQLKKKHVFYLQLMVYVKFIKMMGMGEKPQKKKIYV